MDLGGKWVEDALLFIIQGAGISMREAVWLLQRRPNQKASWRSNWGGTLMLNKQLPLESIEQ